MAADETINAPQWFAIYTRSRHEKFVARQLAAIQMETFLPLRAQLHRWRDRYKKVETPLFGSYVFARFLRQSPMRLAVLKTPGVVRIVGFGQKDAPVPDDQIDTLRRVMESKLILHRHRYLRAGQRVRVVSGALAGVEGILTRVKNLERLVIVIEPVQRALALQLSGYEIVPIGTSNATLMSIGAHKPSSGEERLRRGPQFQSVENR